MLQTYKGLIELYKKINHTHVAYLAYHYKIDKSKKNEFILLNHINKISIQVYPIPSQQAKELERLHLQMKIKNNKDAAKIPNFSTIPS